MNVGTIKEIVRYPVKSFAGESVDKTLVMDYGLYGDRSHAYVDQTRDGKFLTVTQLQDMVLYQANFDGPETVDTFSNVSVISPQGKRHLWNDQELLEELEQLSGRQITTIQYSPTHVPLGAIEEEHILLVSNESLNGLAEIWGKAVDARRFRPNLLLELFDGIPFMEEMWIGKQIKIGKQVVLEIVRHCERCMIVTVDPVNATKDQSLLKKIVNERQNHFGVYAKVIQTGEIHNGDAVSLLQDY